MAPEVPNTCFEFDGFRLDAARRRLSRIDDDETIALAPRAFDTLLALVRRHGELVGRSELLDQVWPRRDVETNTLDRNISLLRRALGDRRNGASFIATLAGRGYQFIAPVRLVGAEDAAQAADMGLAAQLYEQAKALVLHPTLDNIRGAVARLEQLVRREPGSCRAWSLLAHAYGAALNYDFPLPDALARAAQAARSAVAIDAEDGGAQAAMALVHAVRGNWLEADDGFRRAANRPGDPLVASLRCLYLSMSVGHVHDALEEARGASRLGLAQPYGSCMLALAHALVGNDDEARQAADRTCALGFPAHQAPIADLYAQLALRAGDVEAVRAILGAALTPPEQAAGGGQAVDALCEALAGRARPETAVAALRSFECSMGAAVLDAVPRRRIAQWYVQLGALEAAYEILQRALDRDAAQGSVGSAWGFLWSPEMKSFRADKRFGQLTSRLKMPGYWRERGLPQVRAAT